MTAAEARLPSSSSANTCVKPEWAQRVTDHAVSGFGDVAMAAGARCEAIEHFEADIVEGP